MLWINLGFCIPGGQEQHLILSPCPQCLTECLMPHRDLLIELNWVKVKEEKFLLLVQEWGITWTRMAWSEINGLWINGRKGHKLEYRNTWYRISDNWPPGASCHSPGSPPSPFSISCIQSQPLPSDRVLDKSAKADLPPPPTAMVSWLGVGK